MVDEDATPLVTEDDNQSNKTGGNKGKKKYESYYDIATKYWEKMQLNSIFGKAWWKIRDT